MRWRSVCFCSIWNRLAWSKLQGTAEMSSSTPALSKPEPQIHSFQPAQKQQPDKPHMRFELAGKMYLDIKWTSNYTVSEPKFNYRAVSSMIITLDLSLMSVCFTTSLYGKKQKKTELTLRIHCKEHKSVFGRTGITVFLYLHVTSFGQSYSVTASFPASAVNIWHLQPFSDMWGLSSDSSYL